MPTTRRATLESVWRDLITLGVDAGAVVRVASDDRRVGLMILMSGDRAIRRLGPICIEAAQREACNEPAAVGLFLNDKPIEVIFERMDRERRTWLWGNDTEATGLVVCFFAGAEVCEWLAPRLSAAGCPASLV
jgi:hypothetical protein